MKPKAIICLESGVRYASIAETAMALMMTDREVKDAIKFEKCTRGGRLRYDDDAAASNRPASEKKCRPVVCFETGRRYASVRDAANDIGISNATVSRCASKGYAAHGYHLYYEDQGKPSLASLSSDVSRSRERPVVCLETKKRYSSISAASRALGVHHACICRAAKLGRRVHGVHFSYENEKAAATIVRNSCSHNKTESSTRPASASHHGNCRPIMCPDTGRRYLSLVDAAWDLGTSSTNVLRAAKTGGTARGVHLHYANGS